MSDFDTGTDRRLEQLMQENLDLRRANRANRSRWKNARRDFEDVREERDQLARILTLLHVRSDLKGRWGGAFAVHLTRDEVAALERAERYQHPACCFRCGRDLRPGEKPPTCADCEMGS